MNKSQEIFLNLCIGISIALLTLAAFKAWFQNMTKEEEIIQTIKVLRQEVEVLTKRLRPAGTGYLITTIDTLNSRIDELMLEAIAPMLEDGPIDRTRVTQEEMTKFYNDGPHIGVRENDDGTWDMSAAARMATDDDVEHTKEYYTDKDRNRNAMSTADAESLGD